MPVVIKAVDLGDDPRVITLEEYLAGRQNFNSCYYLANCSTKFGGQDIQVPWATFNEAVESFITTYNVDPTTVALRFVYDYDPIGANLFLRLQICTMEPVSGSPNTFQLYDTQCAWYQITNNSMVATQSDSLTCPNYINNFYYCSSMQCSPSSAVPLSSSNPNDLYAIMVTFPWYDEVLQMYTDNDLPGNGYICFGACSYINGGQGSAPIAYPHGTVLYLRDQNGVALLDNENEVVLFNNKGCDMGTLCPSVCGVYILPVS